MAVPGAALYSPAPLVALFPKLRWIVIPFQSYVGSDIDFSRWLALHAEGNWGELDTFDQRQNDRAVKEGLRILSAYDVPVGGGNRERIWIITEADRSTTTILLPAEY